MWSLLPSVWVFHVWYCLHYASEACFIIDDLDEVLCFVGLAENNKRRAIFNFPLNHDVYTFYALDCPIKHKHIAQQPGKLFNTKSQRSAVSSYRWRRCCRHCCRRAFLLSANLMPNITISKQYLLVYNSAQRAKKTRILLSARLGPRFD